MRVLLQLGAARPTDQGAFAPLAAALLATLEGEGIAVAYSREIIPDLETHELAHLLAAPPLDLAVRQFIHARRWGRPVVVSLYPQARPSQPEQIDQPARRYESALRDLLLHGADGVVALGEVDEASEGRGRPAVRVRLEEPTAGETLRETYATVQERARMTGEDAATAAGQWLPGVSAEEYGKHLEDLCQLQLELIAYRDAEYEQLHQQFDDAQAYGGGDRGAGHRALQGEYERLGEWSRELTARHEALQSDYAQLQRWAGELEAQLRDARAGGVRARVRRVLRRG